MSIDVGKASNFVHQHGTLFERALFDFLFAGGSAERVQAIIMCYKNPDGGFGHGFEHDIKAPHSHPLALEYLLSVMKHNGIKPGAILPKRGITPLRPGGRKRAVKQCRIALSRT